MNFRTLFWAYREANRQCTLYVTLRPLHSFGIEVAKDHNALRWQRYNRLSRKLYERIITDSYIQAERIADLEATTTRFRNNNARLTLWRADAELLLMQGDSIIQLDGMRIAKLESRIAELEVAVTASTQAVTTTQEDARYCIAGLKVRIAELESLAQSTNTDLMAALQARDMYRTRCNTLVNTGTTRIVELEGQRSELLETCEEVLEWLRIPIESALSPTREHVEKGFAVCDTISAVIAKVRGIDNPAVSRPWTAPFPIPERDRP